MPSSNQKQVFKELHFVLHSFWCYERYQHLETLFNILSKLNILLSFLINIKGKNWFINKEFYKTVFSDKFNEVQLSEIFSTRRISYCRNPVCSYERVCHMFLKGRLNYVSIFGLLLFHYGIYTISNIWTRDIICKNHIILSTE